MQALRGDGSESAPKRLELNWVRFRDPGVALGLALFAVPLELALAQPAIIFFMHKALVPKWKETYEHIRSSGKPNAELLDSLWVLFYTLTGELVAPALSLVLLESGNALRDLTAVREDQAKVDPIPSRLYWVERGGRRRRIHSKHLKMSLLIFDASPRSRDALHRLHTKRLGRPWRHLKPMKSKQVSKFENRSVCAWVVNDQYLISTRRFLA